MANANNSTNDTKVSLATLRQQRASSKGSLSRIKNLVEANNSLSYIELECRLGMVESYYKQAVYYQSQIENQEPSDAGRIEIDELYVTVKSKLRALYEQRKPSRDINSPEQSFILSAPIQNRLPSLQLPRFDGKYSDYKNFIHSFNSLVHNDPNISKIEKFNYLLSCLSGDALSTVKAFQITETNYELAIDRLKSRYDNETLIFLENVATLFDVPAATKADPKQLRTTVDTISAVYSSLKSLSTTSQILDAVIIHLAMTKVDSATKKRWQEQLSYAALPTWENCCQMLDKRCQQLDAQGKSTESQSSSTTKSTKKNTKQYSLLTKSTEKQKTERVCAFCTNNNHSITTCQHFIVLPCKDKREKVKQLRLCFNCLAKGHGVAECSSKHTCRFCKERHHSLIHQQAEFSAQYSSAPPTIVNKQEEQSTSAASHATMMKDGSLPTRSTVILATAMILIKDSSGCYQLCRALLDSCSQVNLLTHSFAQMLNLRKFKTSVDIYGVGSTSIKSAFQTQTTIRSRLSTFEQSIEFLLSPHITGYQPDESISIDKLSLPRNIDFADPDFNRSRGIDALLGTEVFFSLLASGRIHLGKNLPTLQETELGWIVSGKCETSGASSTVRRNFCTTFDVLNSNVERLWKLEQIVTESPTLTTEQQQCEQHFEETVQVSDENRIIVRLPFKGDPNNLGNSRDIALKRFYWLEQRLAKMPAVKVDYAEFLREYEALGHMSLVQNPDLSRAHYFIPHHCVLKPSSETTKLRVVFDASCRSASQTSLNDLLMVGPTIQHELFITLIRFRQHRYGLMADVKKMYRQIMVHPDHRRFQLILWRESASEVVSTYMLNTVTYGTAAAPHLAIRSLQYAADNCPLPYELGKSIIRNDFYVDDMVTGADDLVMLQQVRHEVTEVLGFFKMELCKWHCSHPKLNAITERELQLDDAQTSALGVKWDPAEDEFNFKFQFKHIEQVTKRSILSLTSSFFDPLGLINPVIITPRILLQQLWVQKLSWDEPVPAGLDRKVREFLDDLLHLSELHIPRFVRMPNTVRTQLHGFCDASLKAYGCCLYIRCEDSLGKISTKLLTSKSRVAPIKTTLLPRLELCSAHLLVKLWAKIQPHLAFDISQIHFWSDSHITLHWIHSESSTLSVFVGNRVADIQNLATNVKWHHIQSASNPADLISRGCSVRELKSTLWLNGPEFLNQKPQDWPLQPTPSLTNIQLSLERRRKCFVNQLNADPYIVQQTRKYSSHLRCVRIFAYVLRFGTLKLPHSTVISAVEMKNAILHLVWTIQHHHFDTEINLLKRNKQVTGTLSNLCPFLDQVGNLTMLRVGGRLNNADLPFQVRHPLLLPKSEEFVISLVTHIHRTNFHAGPRALVALVQQEYWIINCRALANQIVHKCIHCTRYKPKLLTQVMGNLPKERVNSLLPFTVTGVDFAGPILTYLKIRGKVPYKSYIAVFICFASKAVHLEAVTDLSAEAFIAALKRFVGRRGLPSKLFCDNATNFTGANSKLKELRELFTQQATIDDIQSHCANLSIEFNFIPPRAPHFGGLWEAAVKTAKTHLYKTLSNARLTFEELTTALIEIEAVMNSRPITSLSADPNDLTSLTPGELLVGKKLKSIPEPVNTSQEISLLDRWKRIAAIKLHFWRRWHAEYLHELQRRNRWHQPMRNIQIGDLVTIHEDNLPPMKWLIGRVTHVFEGADRKVRVAEVKTSQSTFKRPITKLALLPLLNQADSMGAGMLSQQAVKG